MRRRSHPEEEERAALIVEVLRRATEDSPLTRYADQRRTERAAGPNDVWRRAALSPLRRTDRRGRAPSPESIFFA